MVSICSLKFKHARIILRATQNGVVFYVFVDFTVPSMAISKSKINYCLNSKGDDFNVMQCNSRCR